MDENTQKLVTYIKQELAKGESEEKVRKSLQDVGWLPDQISVAFDKANVMSTADGLRSPETKQRQDQTKVRPADLDDHAMSGEIEQNTKIKQRRFPRTGLVILVLLLLIGLVGAVYGYFYVYLAPDRVVARSIEQMRQVESFDYSGSMILKISGDLYSDTVGGSGFEALSLFTPREFSTEFSGSWDGSDAANYKADNTINIAMNGVNLAEIQLMTLGEVFYIKLNSLNTFGLYPVDKYLNAWLFVNKQELYQKYEIEPGQDQSDRLSEEDEMKITASYELHKPLEIIEKLDSEQRNQKELFHYKYRINKEKLKMFLEDVSEVLRSYPQTQDVDFNELNDVMDGLEFYEGEIWIGKEDYYLYGLTGGISTQIPGSEASIELAVEADFDKYNHPKDIIAPIEYMTVDDVSQMMMEDLTEIYYATDSSMIEDDLEYGEFNEFLRALRFSPPDVSGMSDEQ